MTQKLQSCTEGCIKNQGAGYSRQDKLTENLWKKHGNLGVREEILIVELCGGGAQY
jgi:hypothetical protein